MKHVKYFSSDYMDNSWELDETDTFFLFML